MAKPRQTDYGKGDHNRSNKKKYDEQYERIFGKKDCTLNHKHSEECKGEHS